MQKSHLLSFWTSMLQIATKSKMFADLDLAKNVAENGFDPLPSGL